jgi:hypothetical protein
MKKSGLLAVAAALSLSTGVFAAEIDFDKGISDVQDAADALKAPPQGGFQHPGHLQPGHDGNGVHNTPQFPIPQFQPVHPQPGNDHGHGSHPGPQPWDQNHHWDNDHGHGNHPGPQPWDNHNHHPYSPVYSDMNCRTWQFTSQTANTRTEELTGEEPGFDCYTDNGTQYCRPTGNYFSRKITVNIGPRKLESWEKESLKVCLDSAYSARVDTSGMLYEYAVDSKDNDGFFGSHFTAFTLTPGVKKPSNPAANELSINSVGAGSAGDVRLVLNDNRADYFSGEKIDISIDGMNIPNIDTGAPVQDILNSFVNIKVKGSFDVAPTYEFILMNKPKAGKYVITITFSRRGPLSSGAAANTMGTFELQ